MRALKSISFAVVVGFAVVLVHFIGTDVSAQSNYYSSRCGSCHSTATASTCKGCHFHGARSLKATPNKNSYAAGEVMSVTLSGGNQNGWIRATLFDQTGNEVNRSNGNLSGYGGASNMPSTLTAAAPVTPGTYTWKAGWYGHKTDTSALGAGWTADTGNANHGYEKVSFTFTVAGAPDTTAPTVNAFTLPASSSSLTFSVSSFTASDDTAVTGYLITNNSTKPAASATGWNATAPATVTAPGEGSTTFYAWAKDAAGNVSASSNATVTVTLPVVVVDNTAPAVTAFSLPATADSLTIPVNSFTATDDAAVTGYIITTSSSAPAAGAAGWKASAPVSVTASGSGSITFYAWAKDAAGNVSLSSSATVDVTVVLTGPALSISTLEDKSYTKTRTLNISGSAIDPDGLKSVTVNRKLVKFATDGSFSRALKLRVGANVITITATDLLGNQSTDVRTVTYDPKAPVLKIVAPSDHMITNESYMAINGRTNDQTATVTVKVNNGTADEALATGTDFTANVYLEQGVNTIYVTATDAAGNTSMKKRTVTYDSASPALEITSPDQDIASASSKLVIKGKVADDTRVKVKISVNGRTATVPVKKGVFTRRITLSSAGSYPVTLTATDAAGNTSSVTRTIIYDPQDDEDGDDDNTASHPFGWTNPRSSHQNYVNSSNVSSCTSCHSTASSSKGQPMSCYNCHGKEW